MTFAAFPLFAWLCSNCQMFSLLMSFIILACIRWLWKSVLLSLCHIEYVVTKTISDSDLDPFLEVRLQAGRSAERAPGKGPLTSPTDEQEALMAQLEDCGVV